MVLDLNKLDVQAIADIYQCSHATLVNYRRKHKNKIDAIKLRYDKNKGNQGVSRKITLDILKVYVFDVFKNPPNGYSWSDTQGLVKNKDDEY